MIGVKLPPAGKFSVGSTLRACGSTCLPTASAITAMIALSERTCMEATSSPVTTARLIDQPLPPHKKRSTDHAMAGGEC